ncbi:MAG: hypothetical protein ACPL68_01640 [Candidatus Hydrothermia bacterium]
MRAFVPASLVILIALGCRKTNEESLAVPQANIEPFPAVKTVVREGDLLGIILDRVLNGEDYAKALMAVDSVIGAKKNKARRHHQFLYGRGTPGQA